MGFRDIRYAIRSLVHDAGVSTIVILCLSLGIGVNATLFSVVDGVLIQPLPFAEPDRLLYPQRNFRARRHPRGRRVVSDLRDWKERTTLRAMAARERADASPLRGRRAGTHRRRGDHVGYVPDPRRAPILGRHLRAGRRPARRRTGRDAQSRVWQRRYQGDPNIIGRSVSVNGQARTRSPA